jgi:hypothetical protein
VQLLCNYYDKFYSQKKNYYDKFSSIKSPPDPKGKLPILPVHVNKPEGLTNSKWAAPEEANLKVNVDAGWDVATKQVGLGLIIRDHRGRVILTEWKFLPGCISAEEAKALACLDGIKQAIKLQCINVTVEIDCTRVVQIMNSVSYDRSPSWCVHLEVQELLKIYRHIKVTKVDRVSNGVAHVLAQLGKSGASGSLRGSHPECVSEVIANDCKFSP